MMKPPQPRIPVTQGAVMPLDDLHALVRARHGLFLANRNDVFIGYAFIRYGEHGEIEGRFLSSLVRPGATVVEVGANIGSHTIPLARRVGTLGRVVAIEAQPAIHRYLCANIALNGLFNVATHACGCGAAPALMRIPHIDYRAARRQNFGGVSLGSGDGGAGGVPVDVVPLDDLLAGLPRLDLIKVDVEGMEADVLAGAQRLIDHHRPRLYLENDRVQRSRGLIEQIQAMGYRLWWHLPRLFNPDNFFGVAENEFGNVVSVNMLCLPKEAAVQVNGLQEVTDSAFHPMAM